MAVAAFHLSENGRAVKQLNIYCRKRSSLWRGPHGWMRGAEPGPADFNQICKTLQKRRLISIFHTTVRCWRIRSSSLLCSLEWGPSFRNSGFQPPHASMGPSLKREAAYIGYTGVNKWNEKRKANVVSVNLLLWVMAFHILHCKLCVLQMVKRK